VKARTFIITISAIVAIVAPAAHAATAKNTLHCSLQSTRVATAYPTTSMGFRALKSAGKSQKPIGNRCTSKSSKTVVASKRQQPVHKVFLPAAAPIAAAVAAPVPACLNVDDSYVARGYVCSGTDPLAGLCPAEAPSAAADEPSVAPEALRAPCTGVRASRERRRLAPELRPVLRAGAGSHRPSARNTQTQRASAEQRRYRCCMS
jgi:hypothetical protein